MRVSRRAWHHRRSVHVRRRGLTNATETTHSLSPLLAQAAAAVSTAPFAFAAPGDYHYESFARTWSDADEYCRNTYGGHLASIDNSADNALFDVLQPGDQWVW